MRAIEKTVFTESVGSVLDEAEALFAQTYGKIAQITGITITIAGLERHAKLGDTIQIKKKDDQPVLAEVIAIKNRMVIAQSYSVLQGVGVGTPALLIRGRQMIYPDDRWRGRTLDAFAQALDDGVLPRGEAPYDLYGDAPRSTDRRLLGGRLATGLSVFDTFLPICRGQRLGVFAGSGVGKSLLLADLVNRVACDVTVVALIGERGREVRSFIEQSLDDKGRERSTIFVSTSDQSPLAKKRAALAAMATAEKYRDDGRQVLLIFDSLTRFAEAHREAALAAGEVASLHGFPPSTFRETASLVERAGPGLDRGNKTSGDITAVFSVLVAGSDTEEPVADMIRGILDGHVVLSRSIAERGRFPAIDVAKSVSRSLPGAALPEENTLLGRARAVLNCYEDAEIMVRAGLYEAGSDPAVDAALQIWPVLDAFIAEGEAISDHATDDASHAEAFERLRTILDRPSTKVAKKPANGAGLPGTRI